MIRRLLLLATWGGLLMAQTSPFPSALDTNSTLTELADRAQTTLNASLNASATSFTVTSAAKFAAGMILTIENEQIKICAVSSNTVTVGSSSCPNVDGRGFSGTSAASHANQVLVSDYFVSYQFKAIRNSLIAIETALGINLTNVAKSGANSDITSLTALSTPLPVNEGGTAATTQSGARAALGAAASGANGDITQLTGLSTPLPVNEGGTGSATAAGSRANLLPSGTQTQKLRIKPNQGNNTTFEFASGPTLFTDDYNFPSQTVASLTAGIGNSITFSPCPLGISGSTTTTYLYFTGAPGAAEAIRITGGTCTSGATTGTIILDSVNVKGSAVSAHTTPTVVSSSGGLQECLNSLPSGTGTCTMNPGASISMHAKVTPPDGSSTIDGLNLYGYALVRASDYPNGHLLDFPIGAITTVQNLWIQNSVYPIAQTSGAALHYQTRSNATVINARVTGGYIGYDFDGIAQIIWNNGNYTADANASQFAGVWIHDTTGTPQVPVNIQFNGGVFALTPTARGMVIYTADLAQFNNLAFGGGTTQLYISRFGTNDYISGLMFSNCVFDNAGTYPIKIDGLGQASNIAFIGGSISGDANGTSINGIDVCYSNSCALTDWSITGVKISGMGGSGIAVGAGASQGTISGALLHSNNTVSGSDGGIKLDTGVTDLVITGVEATNANLASGHQSWALGTIGAVTNVVVTGNDFCGNSTPVSLGGAMTHSIMANNACIDDTVTAVASAATLVFPVNPSFTITGSTGITAVTILRAGARGSLMPTDGPLSFTAGASIGNSYVAPQNRPTAWFYDGTKVWLSGSPAILSSAAATNSTSSIGSTALLTAPVPGLYRVSWTLTTGSVSGGSATSLVTIGWTDAVGAKTSAGAALTLAAAANQSGSALVNLASGNLTYATTYAAGSGGNYNLTLTAERVF